MSRTTELYKIYNFGELLPFGKYQGCKITKYFIEEEISYFKWLIFNGILKFTEDINKLIIETPIPKRYYSSYDDDFWGEYGWDLGLCGQT